MNLYLDTSNNLQTVIKLDDQIFIQEYLSPRDQNVMGALLAALRQSDKTINDLTSISIHPGPGSFTGLRVGFALANALSLALNLPLNGHLPGSISLPYYAKPPSITPIPDTYK